MPIFFGRDLCTAEKIDAVFTSVNNRIVLGYNAAALGKNVAATSWCTNNVSKELHTPVR